MAAKSPISLVSIQKPSAAKTPILQRRLKLTSSIDKQIAKVSLARDGKKVAREQFWTDGNVHYFALRYGKTPLEIERGKSALRATTWDDLVEQLEQLKTITVAGGLDDALAACANAVRSNFKTAKDKKSGTA